jgi:hypothetical protein
LFQNEPAICVKQPEDEPERVFVRYAVHGIVSCDEHEYPVSHLVAGTALATHSAGEVDPLLSDVLPVGSFTKFKYKCRSLILSSSSFLFHQLPESNHKHVSPMDTKAYLV